MTQAGYTLSAEIVGPRLRTLFTIELWSYCWASMTCVTPLIAYLLRKASWRVVECSIALP